MLNPNENRRWFNGTFGNLSVSPTFEGSISGSIGDGIEICKLEPNIKIIDVIMHADALGANSTLKFSAGGIDITKSYATANELSAHVVVDDYLTKEGDVLKVVVGGGAVSGKLRIKLIYEVLGNL